MLYVSREEIFAPLSRVEFNSLARQRIREEQSRAIVLNRYMTENIAGDQTASVKRA